MRKDSILITLLTRGQIKIYREGENGGEFYVLHSTWTACAVSMICASKVK
jgi:CRP/FNR family transcriptional regulator